MTMIEKMARAIQGAGFPAERMSDADADDCARAALMAIREPSMPVAADGCRKAYHTLEGEGFGDPTSEQSCANIFAAMIDAILAGKA